MLNACRIFDVPRFVTHWLARCAWIIILLLSVFRSYYPQEPPPELKADLTALDAARARRDLDMLDSEIQRNAAKWRARDHQSFVNYAFTACSALSSYNMGNRERQAVLLNR